MQESEYTTDGRDSHPSPAGTSRSDVSPQQLTAGSFLMWYVCHEPLVHKYTHSQSASEPVLDVDLDSCSSNVHYITR